MAKGNVYDWSALQAEYNTGLSIKSLAVKHGMATRSFVQASKRGEFKTRSRSEAIKQSHINDGPRVWSIEAKDRHSEIMSTKMVNRKVASKRFDHNGVILESSWEKKVAESLDEAQVNWIRPEPILYTREGQIKRYYPDFYLPDYDVYLDPKNDYVRKLDENKLILVIEQSKIKLLVLNENQLCWNVIQQLIGW